MNGSFRHQLIYRTLRPLLVPFLKLRFRYRYDPVSPRSTPYIVVCNHTTSWDPLLVALAFSRPMYFLASEHIFRWGFLSKLIVFLQAPISRLKATTDTSAVRQVLQRLKTGSNVCIFPEGCCTYSGETGPISGAIGKLVRHSGAGLITFRIEGGYFTDPRWGRKTRRGPMRGILVREYAPEEIASLSVEAVNAAISRDLYFNAYERQREHPAAYPGRRLAESLETALYLCPACGGLATLRSEGDFFSCSCGLRLRYRPDGFFADCGGAPPFDTVFSWFRWQGVRLRELAEQAFSQNPDQPILVDEEQEIVLYQRGGTSTLVGSGALSLYRDRMELQSEGDTVHSFPFAQISDMTIHGRNTLMFTMPGPLFYEIPSKRPRSALPYQELYEAFRQTGPGSAQPPTK